MPYLAVVTASVARISAALRIFMPEWDAAFTPKMITASAGEAAVSVELLELLDHARRRSRLSKRVRGWCFCRVLLSKILVVPQIAIKNAGQLCSLRSKGRPSALEEEHRHDAAVVRVRKGGEPAKTRAIIGAGARLAQHRKLAEVRAQRPCGAVG